MLPACYLDEGILADTNLATNDTANKVELLCICSIISERQNRPDQVLGTEAEIRRLKDTARKRERDKTTIPWLDMADGSRRAGMARQLECSLQAAAALGLLQYLHPGTDRRSHGWHREKGRV